MSEQHTTEMMDALVWVGPHEMVLRAAPVPDLAPGEVLLQIDAVGICGDIPDSPAFVVAINVDLHNPLYKS